MQYLWVSGQVPISRCFEVLVLQLTSSTLEGDATAWHRFVMGIAAREMTVQNGTPLSEDEATSG